MLGVGTKITMYRRIWREIIPSLTTTRIEITWIIKMYNGDDGISKTFQASHLLESTLIQTKIALNW